MKFRILYTHTTHTHTPVYTCLLGVRVWKSKYTLKILRSNINSGVRTYSNNCVLHIDTGYISGVWKKEQKSWYLKDLFMAPKTFEWKDQNALLFLFSLQKTVDMRKSSGNLPGCCEGRYLVLVRAYKNMSTLFFSFSVPSTSLKACSLF